MLVLKHMHVKTLASTHHIRGLPFSQIKIRLGRYHYSSLITADYSKKSTNSPRHTALKSQETTCKETHLEKSNTPT